MRGLLTRISFFCARIILPEKGPSSGRTLCIRASARAYATFQFRFDLA
jgi:hypothetical protein